MNLEPFPQSSNRGNITAPPVIYPRKKGRKVLKVCLACAGILGYALAHLWFSHADLPDEVTGMLAMMTLVGGSLAIGLAPFALLGLVIYLAIKAAKK